MVAVCSKFASTSRRQNIQLHQRRQLTISIKRTMSEEIDQSQEISEISHHSESPSGENDTPNAEVSDGQEPEAPEEDDEFGSFDEASFDEFQAEEPEEAPAEPTNATFSSAVFQSESLIDQRVEETLDKIFTIPELLSLTDDHELLRNGAGEKLSMLSKIPHLLPPNWTRLNIRHRLLVNLGIPINLDELEKGNVAQISHTTPHPRKKSISEHDIDWTGFQVPGIETLNLDDEKKKHLLSQTNTLLDNIEEFNLQNTSQLFLETSSDEGLEEKLNKMRDNHKQLLELSSIWQDQIRELKNSQEMYELVVQNMVGYSQRLRRNEILESLSRRKLKKGKRSF